MSDVRVVPATAEHAAALVPLMTDSDRVKLEAITGEQPTPVLCYGIDQSVYTFCGMDGAVPLCIGGVIPLSAIGDEGLVWMVAQPALNHHKKRFLSESRRILAEMQDLFPILRNYEPNGRDFRWLRWLGFELGDEVVLNGIPLVPIERRSTWA